MKTHLCLALFVLFGACNNYEAKSRETFSSKFSCPEDRITSKARTDLKSYDLTFGPQPKKEPPAEVRSDPGRLAVWEEQQQQELKSQNSWNKTSSVFEVSGCEQKAFYICMTSDQGRAFCKDVRSEYLPEADRPAPTPAPETPTTMPR